VARVGPQKKEREATPRKEREATPRKEREATPRKERLVPFERTYPPAQPTPGPARWFVFQKDGVLVRTAEAGAALPVGGPECLSPLEVQGALYVGTINGQPCMAATLADEGELPEGFVALGLRQLFGQVSQEEFGVAGYASQLLYWQRGGRFCAFCGSPTEPVEREWGRRCTSCAHVSYPHVSPCVIVLIHRGDEVLLSHKPFWGPMRSIIAGFVEPGESLEECLIRETREEVGVEVDEIRYFGSQPWPFPHQLMVGFFARYAGGEVRPDPDELDEAAFYHVDNLPVLPMPLSIARQMLDAWIASRGR
jgi:NAD+ diphosphatase